MSQAVVVPVMAQPQAVVMSQPVAVMQQDPLVTLNGVYIQQVFEAAELCGCEMPNRYKVFQLGPDGKSPVGTPLYYLQEQQKGCGSFLYKQCLGPCRASTIDVHVGAVAHTQAKTHEIKKTCGLSTCSCCHSKSTLIGGGFTQPIEDKAPLLCCTPFCCTGNKVSVAGFDIIGGCIGCGACPFCDYNMKIQGTDGAVTGMLAKIGGGCAELCTGTNRYAIQFPATAGPQQRMALIASAIHLDLNYFEQKKNNN